MPERDRDEFDDIVSRLELDLTFPDDPEPPRSVLPPPQAARPSEPRAAAPEPEPADEPLPFELDDQPDAPDEQFYRQVPSGPTRPWTRGQALAWTGVLGAPGVLLLAALADVFVSRPVLLALGVTFVAGAIYLISQLPEHGPSQRDWPDDGAAL